MDHFCYLCFMFIFVMLSCLFLAALGSPVGKRADLLCVVFSCVFVTFPYDVPGQILSIYDIDLHLHDVTL